MYATCLFCNNALGTNEVLEYFPVGRRLAFDAAKGRLWVICGQCKQWNLSPLETRWEAIEEAERAFRDTKLRMSTENIALARVRGGLELVRIGAPERPEFAAWRYGDQFGRRRTKALLVQYGILSAPVLFVGYNLLQVVGAVGAIALPAGAVAAVAMGLTAKARLMVWRDGHVPAHGIRDDSGNLLRLTAGDARAATIMPDGKGLGWHLTVPHSDVSRARAWSRALGYAEVSDYQYAPVSITGKAAEQALATVLPVLNFGGGTNRVVTDAVTIMSNTPDLGTMLRGGAIPETDGNKCFRLTPEQRHIRKFPAHIRLAMEMSVHEDDERRAMEGELHELEQRWRDADAIAKIADDMFASVTVDQRLNALRDKSASPRG